MMVKQHGTTRRLRRSRLLAGLLSAAIALSLSGCSLGGDVENLIRPPRSTGEQQEIQEALENAIGNAGKGGYVLKYPKTGEYRSAIILEDLNGDGEEEALAFYRIGAENSGVHLNLLQKSGDKWLSVSDVEGASTDVEEVFFGDLDGDGFLEMVVGWSIYTVRDKQMTLYSLAGNRLTKWYEGMYSSAVMTDMTGKGRDDLLLLQTGSGDQPPTAVLWSAEKNEATAETVLTEMGSAALDQTIQQFLSIRIGRLSDTVRGVFADAASSAGGRLTELLYWDGSQLLAPFYDETTGLTRGTYREYNIPAMDVDGDGQIEWPSCQLFPDQETLSPARDPLCRTDWMSLNFEDMTTFREFSSVVNAADGYLLRLEDGWDGKVSASLNREAGTLSLYDISSGARAEILSLRTTPTRAWTGTTTVGATALAAVSKTSPAGGKAEADTAADSTDGLATAEKENGVKHIYRLLEKRDDGVRYEVWFDSREPFSLNMERIRYMFTILNT